MVIRKNCKKYSTNTKMCLVDYIYQSRTKAGIVCSYGGSSFYKALKLSKCIFWCLVDTFTIIFPSLQKYFPKLDYFHHKFKMYLKVFVLYILIGFATKMFYKNLIGKLKAQRKWLKSFWMPIIIKECLWSFLFLSMSQEPKWKVYSHLYSISLCVWGCSTFSQKLQYCLFWNFAWVFHIVRCS